MIRLYSQMHRTDKYSQHSLINWPVWLNTCVFLHELSGCGFAFRCNHLNFRFQAYFEQGVPWHSGNYWVWNQMWSHYETRTWLGKNIDSNGPYREVLITQLNHLASLVKPLNNRLPVKWLMVLIPLKSLKLQVSRIVSARNFLTIRQL